MANNFNYNLRGIQFQLNLKDGSQRFYYFNVIDLPIQGQPYTGFYPFGPITTKANDTALYAAYTGTDPFPVPQDGDAVATTTYIVGLYTAQNVFVDGAVPTAINVTSSDGSTTYASGNPNSHRPPVINLGGLTNLDSIVQVLQSGTNVNTAGYEGLIDYYIALFTHADSQTPNQFASIQYTNIGLSTPMPLGSMVILGHLASSGSIDHPVCASGCIALGPTLSQSGPPNPAMGTYPAYGLAQAADGTFGTLSPIDYSTIITF